MCKYPAPECQPIEEEQAGENEAAGEDNVMSEDDDDEVSDYDDSDESYYTESSVNYRSDSESDAESASGHRVTPDMVLLLMLKENGDISEERYAEKAEKCDKNFKFLIPYLPRYSTDSPDYTKDLELDSSDDTEVNENKDIAEKVEVNNVNKDNVGTSEVEFDKDVIKDRKDIEFIEKVKENETIDTLNDNTNMPVDDISSCDVVTNDIHMSVDDISKCDIVDNDTNVSIDEVSTKHCNEEISSLQEMNMENSSETKDVTEKCQQDNNLEVNEEQAVSFVLKNNIHMSIDDIRKCDLVANDKNVSTDDVSTQHCNEETSSLEQQKIDTNVSKQTDNEKYQQDNNLEVKEESHNVLITVSSHRKNIEDIVIEASNKECESLTVPECIGTEIMTSNDVDISEVKDENRKEVKNLFNEKHLELAEDKSKESNNNTNQDTTKEDKVFANPEETKNENRKSQTNAPGKITKSFKYIIRKLIRENRIPKEDEDDCISYDYGEDYGSHLMSFADSLDQDYQNNTALELSDSEDDNYSLREFAFYLNFYSPSSYKYILETYNTPLPELKVLYSWYLKEDNEPGLSGKAFKMLKEKSSVKRQTCTLMFIDVFLKNDGKYDDQVNYGYEENTDITDKAVMAYVFVLVSLDQDWKMPIGYIFARNIPAETQAEYIRICLTHCHDAGVDVVAVTLETLTPAECLGCSFEDVKNLKTVFKHPSCDREVAVWIDPCLALKSARQTLKIKGVLNDYDNKKIRWNLIRKLRRLHDTTNLENPKFYELRNHNAKIGLTSKTLSKSLIPALTLAEKLLPDMFTDIKPTQRYIAFINMLYDILNTKVTTRMRRVALQLHAAEKYLICLFRNQENNLSPLDRENTGLKRLNGYRFFLKGEHACGLLGFLICIESFRHLYTNLLKKEKRIDSLNPQRLCKVQAEDLVTNLRAFTWADPERFSGYCFKSFYERLFEQLEKNPHFTDKTIPLEQWPLLDKFPPAVTIKLTSGKRSYDDVYSGHYKLNKIQTISENEQATKLVREYSKAMDTEIDLSVRKNMVGFLAGWIAAKFARCLKCEACIDLLYSNKKLWFHKFITLKRIYALCLPSEELFRICWECERALRLKGSYSRINAWVLRRLIPEFSWPILKRSHHPLIHYVQLTRAVIAKYIALRIPAPFSMKDRNTIVEMFERFTKKNPDDSYDELGEWLNGIGSVEDSDFE